MFSLDRAKESVSHFHLRQSEVQHKLFELMDVLINEQHLLTKNQVSLDFLFDLYLLKIVENVLDSPVFFLVLVCPEGLVINLYVTLKLTHDFGLLTGFVDCHFLLLLDQKFY